MKNIGKSLFFVVALLLTNSLNVLWAQTFDLLPDSTITPYSGGIPTGPSETLTGSFSWTVVPSGIGYITAFQLTSLNFESASFSLSLNLENNSYDPDTQSSGVAYFDAEVLQADSSQNLLIMSTDNNGTFEGPFTAPTEVSCPNLSLAPSGGGANIAFLNIDAELASGAPEPSTCDLLLGGMGLLVFWRLRTYGKRNRLDEEGKMPCV